MIITLLVVLDVLALPVQDCNQYRSNAQRTGEYQTEPLVELHSLWWMSEYHFPYLNSPAVADSLVFTTVYTEDEGLFGNEEYSRVLATHRSHGALRWWLQFPSSYATNITIAAGDVALFGCEQGLYAIDPELAQVRWGYPFEGMPVSAPLLNDERVYIGSTSGTVHALDVTTGELLWDYASGRTSVSTAITYGDGRLYFGTEGGEIHALDAESGREIWQMDTYVQITATPAYAYGNIYFTGKDGLYCLDALSGEERWSFPVDTYANRSPAVSDSLVFFGDHNHSMYAISADRSWSNWRFTTEGSDVFSPSVAGDVVYFGDSEGYLYALDKHTGNELWRYCVGGVVDSSPVIRDGVVYFCSVIGHSGVLFALR